MRYTLDVCNVISWSLDVGNFRFQEDKSSDRLSEANRVHTNSQSKQMPCLSGNSVRRSTGGLCSGPGSLGIRENLPKTALGVAGCRPPLGGLQTQMTCAYAERQAAASARGNASAYHPGISGMFPLHSAHASAQSTGISVNLHACYPGLNIGSINGSAGYFAKGMCGRCNSD